MNPLSMEFLIVCFRTYRPIGKKSVIPNEIRSEIVWDREKFLFALKISGKAINDFKITLNRREKVSITTSNAQVLFLRCRLGKNIIDRDRHANFWPALQHSFDGSKSIRDSPYFLHATCEISWHHGTCVNSLRQ